MPEKKKPAVSFGPYSTDRQTSIECAVWQNEVTVNEKPGSALFVYRRVA